MGRSYVTVRALVLVVTLLVILEYFSLMQSAENADKRVPIIFRIDTGDKFRRHVLQAIDPALFSFGPPTLASSDLNMTTTGSRVTTPRTNTSQCPIIPPCLHGRFPVQACLSLFFLMLEGESGMWICGYRVEYLPVDSSTKFVDSSTKIILDSSTKLVDWSTNRRANNPLILFKFATD